MMARSRSQLAEGLAGVEGGIARLRTPDLGRRDGSSPNGIHVRAMGGAQRRAALTNAQVNDPVKYSAPQPDLDNSLPRWARRPARPIAVRPEPRSVTILATVGIRTACGRRGGPWDGERVSKLRSAHCTGRSGETVTTSSMSGSARGADTFSPRPPSLPPVGNWCSLRSAW
jgi:hypothetical protein